VHSAFQYQHYQLRKQVLALTGVFRVYNPAGEMVLYTQQKMFRLREDIRIYADESKSQEVLLIKARNILDFSAAYDVIDAGTGLRVGTWRRKGWRSMLRDEWHLLDPSERQTGLLTEDNLTQALLRRFLLGRLLPQNYDLIMNNTRAADLRQQFHFFRYILDIDLTPGMGLDPRMAVAAGILLGIIEGKQESS
jgi:uncharacterized protein YxjI